MQTTVQFMTLSLLQMGIFWSNIIRFDCTGSCINQEYTLYAYLSK